jgi:hypothetical protein
METSKDIVASGLEKLLNIHGYAFQFSVVERMHELRQKGKTLWDLEATEIPVSLRGSHTHVDFVGSRLYDYNGNNDRFFLVAECKKADPATANWCFAQVPRHSQFDFGTYIQFDQVVVRRGDMAHLVGISKMTTDRPIMGLGLEHKTGAKGDGIGSTDRSAINSAIAQVLRGASGYMNYLANGGRATRKFEEAQPYVFIPVIFTTANLFVTENDLSKADLSTGELSKGTTNAKPVDWIWFNYNRSLQLSSELPHISISESTGSKYFYDFTRTIAIVGATGVDNFLEYYFRNRLAY